MQEVERSRRPEPRAKQKARAESNAGAIAEQKVGAIARLRTNAASAPPVVTHEQRRTGKAGWPVSRFYG